MILFEDFNAQHPYSQIYGIPGTGARRLVSSGLPMARKTDGSKLKARWIKNGDSFFPDTNLFEGEVKGTAVGLSCVNAQPNGALKNDELAWNPELKIGIEIIEPVDKPRLLDIDPINPNYEQNTLEWDYVICKRRLRIIEGRIKEQWIFADKPDDAVSIKHNKTGRLPLKIGHGSESLDIEVKDSDTEYVQRSKLLSPMIIGGSGTFYPDADVETNTVDGYAEVTGDAVYATIRAAAGTASNDSGVYMSLYLVSSSTANQYTRMGRLICLFNTAAIGATNTISKTVLKLRLCQIYAQMDTYNGWDFALGLVSSNPASNTAIVNADYSCLGTTRYCDNDIPILNTNTAEYSTQNNWFVWSFNATGEAAISKTGITKLGIRDRTDIDAGTPTYIASKPNLARIYTADKGAGYKPTLEVEYVDTVAPRYRTIRIRNHGV